MILGTIGSRPAEGEGQIFKLTWAEVGAPAEAGRYESRYGLIEVTVDDLFIWTKFPRAAFVVMQPSPFWGETVSRLGTFELRDELDGIQGERLG